MKFRKNRRGASLGEYAILCSIISLVSLFSVLEFGSSTGYVFTNVAERVETANIAVMNSGDTLNDGSGGGSGSEPIGGSGGSESVSETVIESCYDPANLGMIGQAGWTGNCDGMLIVSNDMLRSVASSAEGGNESFSIVGPDGNTYTFDDTTFNIFTGQVTSMQYLFYSTSFNDDIAYWDVSNVTNMDLMFNVSRFNRDISRWDVSKVTRMAFTFAESQFNGDISNWDVSNVVDMSSMFVLSPFNGDLSQWDTSNVRFMRSMFLASSFSGDISGWDVSSVEDMSGMFNSADNFNQDISGWDTSRVTDMESMFGFNQAFNQDLSRWCVSLITSAPLHFAGSSRHFNSPSRHPQWGTCPNS